MKLAVPKECRPGERRVAVTPENVARLIKMGFAVAVEHDAGAAASFGDDDYVAAGAEIVADTRAIWQTGDILLKVQPPAMHPALGVHEADLIRERGTLISFLYPGKNKDIVDSAGGAQGHGDRGRSDSAHHARAEDGRAVVDGEHRRLSRGGRSGEFLRTVLHRPDDRGRQGARRPRCW